MIPAAASTTKTMTSASAIASRACSWTRLSIASPGSTSSPPVSTTRNRRPFQSASPYSRSRVVRARSSTIAWRVPRIRLNRVLLPTFGRPTIGDDRQRVPRELTAGRSGGAGGGWRARRRERGRPPGGGGGRAQRGHRELVGAGRRRRRPGELEDPLGDRLRGPRSASTCRRSRRRRGRFRTRSRRRGRATPSIWIACVPAISHSRVSSFVFADERPPTTTMRSTSRAISSVSSWRRIVTGQTVLTILSSWLRDDHVGGQPLELPGRLGALRDERHLLAPRDLRPVVLLVDDDRVRREAEQTDDLGVARRAEQDDRVALLDEPDELALLLDHPGARPVDHLEAARLGALHDLGPDAVGADHDRGAVVDVVERLDGAGRRSARGRGSRPRCGRPGRGCG